MVHSSPATGQARRESLRRSLAAEPNVLIMQNPASHMPGSQPSRQDMALSYENYTVAPTTTASSYYQPPGSERGYSKGHAYGIETPLANNTNNSAVTYNQGDHRRKGRGAYSTDNNPYSVNDSNDLGYQAEDDDPLDEYAKKPAFENHDDNKSDSDVDSDEDSSRNAVQVFEGIIRNEEHYKDTLARRLRKASLNDQVSDLPKTEEQQRALVKELFESIIDTRDVLDKPGKNGKPAQAVRRFRSGYYSNREIELKCWEILFRCRDASMGIKLPGLDAKSKKEEYADFHARFQKILHSCKISKALCKQIMDPTYISRLVAAPGAEIQMKFNNKKINAERDIQNEIGRKAVKRGLKLNDLDRLIGQTGELPTTVEELVQQDIKVQQEDAVELPPAFTISQSETKNLPKTPQTATTPKKLAQTASNSKTTSTKRKSASSAKSYRGYNPDNEDSDGYTETPAKRHRSSAKPRATPAQTRRHTLDKARCGSNTSMLNTIGSSSPNQQTSHVGPLLDREFSVSGGLNSMTLTSSFEPRAPMAAGAVPALSEAHPGTDGNSHMNKGIEPLELSYKFALCELLGVHRNWSDLYSLHQLRTYARAYNKELAHREWHHAPNYSATGYMLFVDGIFCREHFAQEIPIYQALAVARGDLTRNGEFIPNNPGLLGFPPQTDPKMREALGIVHNPFGLHDDYDNDTHHHQHDHWLTHRQENDEQNDPRSHEDDHQWSVKHHVDA